MGVRAPRFLTDQSFGAVVFDWDGTAVPDRHASARAVRARVEALSALGVHLAVVSGTHVGNIDGQLLARPPGPGRLLLGLNRGSELFEVGAEGPQLLSRRRATKDEDSQLDLAAATVVEELSTRGLPTRIVSSRLNRRKIDLIPLPEWDDPPKARISELVSAVTERLHTAGIGGLREVVAVAQDVSTNCGLDQARITSDAKHVEIGLTDKADSMRAVLGELWQEGIGSGLVLVIGDEFGSLGGVPGSDSLLLTPAAGRCRAVSVGAEPSGVPAGVEHWAGGPRTFVSLLEEQLSRRRHLRVPDIDEDPAWTMTFRGLDPARQGAEEALFTIGAGGFATRGAVEEQNVRSMPAVFAADVYEGEGPSQHLKRIPSWTSVDCPSVSRARRNSSDTRTLDLRTGVLRRVSNTGNEMEFRSTRFASTALPGAMAMRVEGPSGEVKAGAVFRNPDGSAAVQRDGAHLRMSVDNGPSVVEAMGVQRARRVDGISTVERLAAYVRNGPGETRTDAAQTLLEQADERGFDRLLCDQRTLWARRWSNVGVSIPDDPQAELAIRFALFQLWANTTDHGELGVGARGLSGTGYSGHVFWDADVFVLPAVLTMDPAIAQAMVRYRTRRLARARSWAAAKGYRGARFPWESARSGEDVTPDSGNLGGQAVPILTGQREEHITADVAWGAVMVSIWTGRPVPRATERLVLETARYWASRCERDPDGSAHIRGVIGPDEYHEFVDDNAFTNVMARWNLRTAARLKEASEGADGESRAWRRLADALTDGYDPRTGVYEQFAGYHALEPLTMADVAPPPVAADVLLGRRRTQRSQIIKQPDALMLHHLVPDELHAGSLRPNLDFYLPRTAHGSSLSPAVSATLLARAGRVDEALTMFRHALILDLDDVTGMTAAGLHMATVGGVWQCIISGFLGARVVNGRLTLRPHLPGAWSSLEARFICLGRRITIRVDTETIEVTTDRPIVVCVGGGEDTTVTRHERFSRLSETGGTK